MIHNTHTYTHTHIPYRFDWVKQCSVCVGMGVRVGVYICVCRYARVCGVCGVCVCGVERLCVVSRCVMSVGFCSVISPHRTCTTRPIQPKTSIMPRLV